MAGLLSEASSWCVGVCLSSCAKRKRSRAVKVPGAATCRVYLECFLVVCGWGCSCLAGSGDDGQLPGCGCYRPVPVHRRKNEHGHPTCRAWYSKRSDDTGYLWKLDTGVAGWLQDCALRAGIGYIVVATRGMRRSGGGLHALGQRRAA